ncbi:MAG TPA: hypothetical protein PLT27_01515 [Nitrospira sp.]|nr:hypothetical protein [Nitrospira sp.]
MSDAELLKELKRQFEERGAVPFSIEEGALIAKLSFTSRSLTPETFREAWNGFLEELGLEELGWPVHFGVAIWYWEHDMRLHAAAVFEHLHRDVRRGYDQIDEVAYYQANYLPRMLQLYAEIADRERVSQLFGRLEELYEDGHVAMSEYSDGLLAAIGTVDERSTDGSSLLHSATRTISDLLERLDSERREKEALKAEVDAGVRFKVTCSETEKDLRGRYASSFPTFRPQTQQFLIEASSWNTEPFRNINPCWSPILYQKAVEYEFNEIVWAPFRRIGMPLPPEFWHERLTINQIYRLLHSAEPLTKGIARSVSERLKIKFAPSPLQATALQKLKDHCNRARHGDRKPYTPADLDACMSAITEGEAIVQILDLFRPR